MSDLDLSCSCLTKDTKGTLYEKAGLCPCKEHNALCCYAHYTSSPYSPSGEDYRRHKVDVVAKAILDF